MSSMGTMSILTNKKSLMENVCWMFAGHAFQKVDMEVQTEKGFPDVKTWHTG